MGVGYWIRVALVMLVWLICIGPVRLVDNRISWSLDWSARLQEVLGVRVGALIDDGPYPLQQILRVAGHGPNLIGVDGGGHQLEEAEHSGVSKASGLEH